MVFDQFAHCLEDAWTVVGALLLQVGSRFKHCLYRVGGSRVGGGCMVVIDCGP